MTTTISVADLHPDDDAPNEDAAAMWHQEQFCEHGQLAADHEYAGRDLLAHQHRRVAAWHRDVTAALA